MKTPRFRCLVVLHGFALGDGYVSLWVKSQDLNVCISDLVP